MDRNRSSILPNEDIKTALSVVEENIETSEDKKDVNSDNYQIKSIGIKYREIETLDLPGQDGPVKNTIHATKFGMKLFSEWCAQNNHNIDLEDISDDKLNDVLGDFFTNVRTQEGKQYSESSLINFKYSIQRYMSSLPEASRKDLKGPEFYRATSILLKVIRETRTSESGKNVPDKSVMIYLTREDIQKIYESGAFNVDEPNSLLHKVWFEVCLHFCRKNREVQRQMNPDLFEFAEDESGRRYVYYKKLLGYRNTSTNTPIHKDAKDCRMVEVKGHPMCPVRSLEKYLSKIKHLTKDGCEPCLFYRPRSLWDKRSNDAKWYGTLPVGKNALSSFMASISNKAELSQTYTPIVLKTLPVSKWREIVFESDKQRVPGNSITQDLVSAIKSPNIFPVQPISLTNYLGNFMVSQQQFSVQPPIGLSQQNFVQGAGDATFAAQLSLPTVRSGLPLTISQAPSRSYHTSNGVQAFPKGNDGRQSLYGNVTLVKPKPVYGTTTSALIKPPKITSLPERNRIYASSTIQANPQCKSETDSSNKNLLKKTQPEILSNQSSFPGSDKQDVQLDKNDKKTSMNYVEAKKAVKDIFDQLDYWALADLVNWMKRVDVLKDTSGKVVCNDPLCKPAVFTTKKTSTKLETSEERTEKESGNRTTAADVSAEVCHENVGQDKDNAAIRSKDVKTLSVSYNTVTPENKNKKPKHIKPYQHIPLIQQCCRHPGKSSKAQGRHVPVILNKTPPRDERSLKSKQVQNVPQALGQNELKPKSVAIRSPLSRNPHYRYRKQVYPLQIFQNTSSTVLPGGDKTSRSLLRNTKTNKKGSPFASSHPTCPPASSIHELAAPPQLKRRKLNSVEPQT